MFRKLILLGLLPTLAGCATLFNGSQQEVNFKTKPEGLIAAVGANHCITPCKLEVQRSVRSFRLYEPMTKKYADYQFQKSVNASAYLNFFNYGLGYIFIDIQEGGGAFSIKDVDVDLTSLISGVNTAPSTDTSKN